MELTLNGIENKKFWEEQNIVLPSYDVKRTSESGRNNPAWLHFGIGNIFRIFIGSIADKLIASGKMDAGLICAETFDFEIVDKIYRPFDNLILSVILNSDGTTKKQVLGACAEAIKADAANADEWARLQEVFARESLQMVSFTITEKGYALTGLDGQYTKAVESDIENGPQSCTAAISIVTSMLYTRFKAGAYPLALVSMDNCSHNGARLQEAVFTVADEWLKKGYVEQEFIDYIRNEKQVAFPWTMIDKITPRPGEEIAQQLKEAGIDNMDPIVTDRKTFIAPYGNAEEVQYLVIEDSFPNGRPALEEGGVYMADREPVNKAEKMKVNTCLNPIHTALCTYDCMLGYELFSDGMEDEELSRLAHRIGYVEGMPVVADPGIISPKAFLDEVIERMSNPYLGDTSQRIATDISQMVGIRFGETVKSYVAKDGTAKDLVGIPLAIAGWLRYLLELDDNAEHFSLAPDPMIPQLQQKLAGIELGKPESCTDQLRSILGNTNMFGIDLYEAGIGEKIEQIFREEIAGPGAVRATLRKYLN